MQELRFEIVRKTPNTKAFLVGSLADESGQAVAQGEIELERLAWALSPYFRLDSRPEREPLDPEGSMDRQRAEAFHR